MSTAGLSNALGEWMQKNAATEIRIAVDEDAQGDLQWSAAIVRDNCHCLEVLDTSAEHATVWGAIGELAYERQPVGELDAQDWGRLGSTTSGGD